tara:strand:+ start:328 stop:600 length:273 start_codon:yes stop_codon:yes gene_type:complete
MQHINTGPLDDLKNHAAYMLEQYRTDETYCRMTDFGCTGAERDWRRFYDLLDLYTDGRLDDMIDEMEPRTRKATEPEVLQIMLEAAQDIH